MKKLLENAKRLVEAAEGNQLSCETISQIETDYAKIVVEGFHQHASLLEGNAIGKNKPGANLLVRLTNKIDETLGFIRDPHVPFTNNRPLSILRFC